jgi:hypothetical protein
MQASSGQTRTCVSCGRAIGFDVNVCPFCGHDYRAAMAGPAAKPKEDSILPVVGGALILLGVLIYFYWAYQMIWVGDWLSFMPGNLSDIFTICGVILIILAVISILGAVFAIRKEHYGLAVLGGVMAILSVIGLIGMILVIVSKDSFKK